ncbi:MAG TPA: hypothetical protein VF091_09040 [Gaiellaceae bacterium]
MQAKTQLRYVKARVDLTTGNLARLAGELVRAGARDAHPTADGLMTIAVIAPSHTAAQVLADDLLARTRTRPF